MRALLAALLASTLLAATLLGASAEDYYRRGNRARQQGRHVEAYLLYSRARALDPASARYALAARGVSRQAARLLGAAGPHRTALESAPDSLDLQPREDLGPSAAVRRAIASPARLRYSRHEASFRFRGTLREAFEEACGEFGVRVAFHSDFDGSRAVRADLSECALPCAVRVLGALGKALAVPVGDDTLFVAEDTPNVRSEVATAAFAALPTGGELAGEAVAEVSQIVQQVLDIERLHAASSGDGILVRGSPAQVDMARSLLADLLRPPGAALIEFRLVSVARSRTARAGLDLPSTFPVTNFSTVLGAVPSAGGTERLIGFGGGRTVLGVSVGDATLEARLDSSAAESLHAARILSAHGKEAVFMAGESYPIATAQYSAGPLDGPGPGTPGYVQPPPNVTFQDLGLNIAVTPLLHSSAEISLQLEVVFKFLAGGAVNGIPVLANREFRSRVRLRAGQFAVVSGTAVYERRRSGAGLAALGRIPWIGPLFRRNERAWSQRDLLILVRPRISRLPPGELASARDFLFGSEGRPVPAL